MMANGLTRRVRGCKWGIYIWRAAHFPHGEKTAPSHIPSDSDDAAYLSATGLARMAGIRLKDDRSTYDAPMGEILTLNYDGVSKTVELVNSRGKKIPITPDSAKRLVQFFSRPEAAQNRTPHSYKLFDDTDDVIAHCKTNAVILYASNGTFLHDGILIELSKSSQFKGLVPAFQHSADANHKDGLRHGDYPPFFVSPKLHDAMNAQLNNPESELAKVSSLQIDKTFVYVDVSGFSAHPVGHQLAIICWLVGIPSNEFIKERMKDVHDDLEASMCIGDGYIFVFRTPHLAAFFAAYLAYYIEHATANGSIVEFHFRMSVHTGLVYRFWDRFKSNVHGRWNYIGKGITDGQRVLESAGKMKDDVIYISAETRAKIREAVDKQGFKNWTFNALVWLENRGRRADKHKEMRRIYEVNHTRWIEDRDILVPSQKRRK